ncbi:MAG: fatty acid--CoA ligase family protein [Pseudomonadales bacterium]|nr:fatty acid--CoA ligase family protein [Pseudomonadales bacterium]
MKRMLDFREDLAVGEHRETSTYADVLTRTEGWKNVIREAGVSPGQTVSLEGEYGAEAVSAFLALLENDNIVVPLTEAAEAQHHTFRELAGVEKRIILDRSTRTVLDQGAAALDHELYRVLRKRGAAGLVLFTSGSTGACKGVVHDLDALLEKYWKRRQRLRTVVFLQLDHIGGVNTLFYTLANGGAVVVPPSRRPSDVCAAIAGHGAQLLPTSPTFLNLLLLSGEIDRHDLSSLELITYGTEPMPQSTLARIHAAFPHVRLQQTYGSTELGILASRSRSNDSLWVQVGGSGYETRIVEGTLRVRSQTAMLGYLNAPSPFDEEGFVDTGDRVELDGDWIRILGRDSEVINVGGSKVHPSEVESAILDLDVVEDVAVRAEPHPILGQVVAARVRLATALSPTELKQRIRRICSERLPRHAIPVKIEVSDEPLHNARFKRMRR